MISDKNFYQLIINNKHYIINMIDELKYYSALKRDDVTFLEKINDYIKDNKMQRYFLKLPNIQQKEGLLYNSESMEQIDIEDINSEKNIISTDKKKELQNVIDEIQTDERERKIENFNQKQVLEIERLKSIKEEFFVLNMIYSEFAKQLSGTSIEKDNKEKYFLQSVENYINIMRYWEEIFNKDQLVRRFFRLKFPKDQDISDEELNAFKDFLKIDVLNMITSISNLTLSTPKMVHFYYKTLDTKSSNIYERFFALFFTIETVNDLENIIQLINSFIHDNTNLTLNKLLQIKLYNIIGSRQINSKLQIEIKKILIKLEFKINNLPNDKRGRIRKDVINTVEKNIEIAKLLA